jgi:hypothetical protein
MAFLSQSGSKTIPEYTGLQVNTSVQVLPIPIIYGEPRCSVNMIYYTNFNSQTSGKSSGGKGALAGGKGSGNQTVSYYASIILAIGEGQIDNIIGIYSDQAVYLPGNFPTNGAYWYSGTANQEPWPYVADNYPDDARSYKNTAYYALYNAVLDSSATVPQINIIAQGTYHGTSPLNNSSLSITTGNTDANGNNTSFIGELALGDADADPALCIYDFLTNPTYGAYFPPSLIDASTLFSTSQAFSSVEGDAALSTYCQAVGLAWSLIINNTESANSILERLSNNLVVAPVWNGALLQFIPYLDVFCGTNPGWDSGNGIGMKYYQPNVIPVVKITLDHILQEEGQDSDPITFNRKDPMEVYNTVRLDYRDRTNYFNDNVAESKDEAHAELYGPRIDNIAQAAEFTLATYASASAQMRLRRNIRIMLNYSFKLGPLWAWLSPMDIIGIPDPSNWNNFIGVRIIAIEDDEKENITVTAEQFSATVGGFSLGAQSPTFVPTTATTPPNQNPTNIPCGPIFQPVVIEPPSPMLIATNYNTPQVIFGASGGYGSVLDSNYGGCDVWVSLDNVSYEQVGQIDYPSIIGLLTAALPAYSGSNPDSTDSLVVNMAESNGIIATTNPTLAASGKSLCIVQDSLSPGGFELLGYTTATMTGANTFALTGLYRGLYGTTARAFSAGSRFLYIGTDANYLELNVPSQYVGQSFWIKFPSFNTFHNYTQDISTCIAYEYVITGPSPDSPPATVPAETARALVAEAGLQTQITTIDGQITAIEDQLGAHGSIVISVSGSWTVPGYVTFIRGKLVGGGGGGGGTSSAPYGAAGGGGGGYNEFALVVTPGGVIAVIVGAGGTAGAAGTAGGTGGTTSFDSTISASGGLGGDPSNTTPISLGATPGGTAIGGLLAGQRTGQGSTASVTGGPANIFGGDGGGSLFGCGGTETGGAGAAGQGYGSGGGGASAGTFAGGAGSPGCVIIEW